MACNCISRVEKMVKEKTNESGTLNKVRIYKKRGVTYENRRICKRH